MRLCFDTPTVYRNYKPAYDKQPHYMNPSQISLQLQPDLTAACARFSRRSTLSSRSKGHRILQIRFLARTDTMLLASSAFAIEGEI
jgi:hypothetical protein